jgi:hypothetical protein
MTFLPEILFLLFYLRISDVYICNQFIFRGFHCTSLALLSLKNNMQYGFLALVERQHPVQTILSNYSLSLNLINQSKQSSYQNDKDYFIKFILIYFLTYLAYDLKHCYKRKDLFIHHMVCFIWGILNYKCLLGHISTVIINEGITFAYFINVVKYQCIYRLLFTTFVRFPLWLINIYWICLRFIQYENDIINICIFTFMFFIDCIWFSQNLKKLKQHL